MSRLRSTTSPRKQQPFSLILEPDELSTLRKIARKEGTSVGAIVRRAIYVVIDRVYPERRQLMIEHEAEVFLNTLAQRYPESFLTAAKRRHFKRAAVKFLA
jgi:hypothetical protein